MTAPPPPATGADTMRLYHIPSSRSDRVLWALEEIRCPYELVTVDWDVRDSVAHRERHPLGRVPVLRLPDGTYMFESPAICTQLADMYPERRLLPAIGSSARALAYQWTSFAMSHVEPVVYPWWSSRRSHADETPHAEAFAPLGAALDVSLSVNPWIAGGTFTVADIVLAHMLRRAHSVGLLAAHSLLSDYVERATGRPACRRADGLDA